MSANKSLLDQPVYWLLGLPFDAVDLAGAVERIDDAVATRDSLVFATPNVNFLALAASRDAFCEGVLNTDLSLADGMPLVWLGRMIGIPFPERVAGSSLVERLQQRDHTAPIRLFLLGGDDGTAERAAKLLNDSGGGLEAVGALNPGFGDIETMSTGQLIARINAAEPDFLLVALGAEKGHAWIERNRSRLTAPVISHLGATVNFLAGTVRRAPPGWQRIGLEWVWRVLQEPSLASRYLRDGMFLVTQFLGSVLPIKMERLLSHSRPGSLMIDSLQDSPGILRISGALVSGNLPELDRELCGMLAGRDEPIALDLSGVDRVDSRALGYLYQLRYRSPLPVVLNGSGKRLERQLQRWRAGHLLG